MYHDVGHYEHPWCISPTLLESHLRYFQEHNIHLITLQELEFLLQVGGELPQDCVVITFDDARKGVYTYALPLLVKYGFKATLFVVSDWLSNPPIATPPNQQYNQFANQREIEECLAQGWELGCHSKTHSKMSTLPQHEQELEIKESKEYLEFLFNTKVTSFAYPYGDYSSGLLPLIKQHYLSALTTHHGLSKTPFEYARQWITSNITVELLPKLLTEQTISVVMIVKNEEQFLQSCLHSIHHLADEIIIADTGSTDSTKEIAQKFTAKVFDIPWENDFSKARNHALTHAQSDWILILDADEIIDSTDIPLIKDAIHHPEIAGYQVVTKNYTKNTSLSNFTPTPGDKLASSFPGYIPSIKVRLFQNNAHYCFSGQVHELVEPSIHNQHGKITPLPMFIHHYGEHRQNEQEKIKFHQVLSEQKVQENPTNQKAFLELAIQQKQSKNYVQAAETLKLLLIQNHHHLPALLELAIVYTKSKDYSSAKITFEHILSEISTLPSELAASYYAEAYAGLAYLLISSPSSPYSTPSPIPPTHFTINPNHHSSTSLFSNPSVGSNASHSALSSHNSNSPTPHSPHHSSSSTSNFNHNPIAAANLYEQSLKYYPQNLLVKINLGATYEQLGQYNKAIAHLKSALTLDPHNSRALYNLAVVYEKQGNLHLAKEYYTQAFTAGHPSAQEHLQKIEEFLSTHPAP